MSQYVRSHTPGGTFFFTVALLERKGSLLVDRVDELRAAFREVRRRRPFVVDAIVVLPDHLHCIWTLPPEDADFSSRWRLIKTRFVSGIPAGERLSARRQAKGERGIWQRRFWEHTIRDEARLCRPCRLHSLQSGQARPYDTAGGLAAFEHSPVYRRRPACQGLGRWSGRGRPRL
jgi:REP element-mobilizing transposase RayT